jgi:hypothetical protein
MSHGAPCPSPTKLTGAFLEVDSEAAAVHTHLRTTCGRAEVHQLHASMLGRAGRLVRSAKQRTKMRS